MMIAGWPSPANTSSVGISPKNIGIEQCTKGHQIVAVPAPDQKHKQRADQRKQNPLVSAHVSGSLVSSGDLPLELFMKMAHAALDLVEPAALKALGVHALLGVC